MANELDIGQSHDTWSIRIGVFTMQVLRTHRQYYDSAASNTMSNISIVSWHDRAWKGINTMKHFYF